MTPLLLDIFESMHLHQQLDIFLAAGSLLLCILLTVGGALRHYILRRDILPPVPLFPSSTFPNKLDTCFIFLFLTAFTLVSMLPSFFPEHTLDNTQFHFSSLLTEVLIFLPIILRYMWLPARTPNKRSSFGVTTLSILLAVFCMSIINGIYESSGLFQLICQNTGSPEFQDPVVIMNKGSLSSKIFIIITAVIVAPVAEECCFRGFLYNILKKYTGRVAAVLSSSLLFAAVHMSLGHTPLLFLLAITFCILYEYTQTLRTPIIAHMVFNLIAVIASLLLGIDA
ncbi:MAG: CPBP family intramembrane metalloprotease [Akkermansiaceae bacterium]|nr:CPBP family intramembrane metalloprotease [Akkermansiaceae bacterium]